MGKTPLHMPAEKGFADLMQIIMHNAKTSPVQHGLMVYIYISVCEHPRV